jgi:hypothetical protein
MTTISEAYILPSPQDIRAMGFVVKLREPDPTPTRSSSSSRLRHHARPSRRSCPASSTT